MQESCWRFLRCFCICCMHSHSQGFKGNGLFPSFLENLADTKRKFYDVARFSSLHWFLLMFRLRQLWMPSLINFCTLKKGQKVIFWSYKGPKTVHLYSPLKATIPRGGSLRCTKSLFCGHRWNSTLPQYFKGAQRQLNSSISLFVIRVNLLHSWSSWYYQFGVFYLCKVVFSGFFQFNGNFVNGQNNSKYCDCVL